MALQLNPRFPLVWRNPFTLQFGVDTPLVRLDDVTNAEERIIAALVAGVTRPGLKVVADDAGASDAELHRLLTRLEPVLTKPLPAPAGRVSVVGTTQTAFRLRSALNAAGLTVVTPDAAADLGIMVCHYVIEPELFGFWLCRDIPHLPIVLADTGVRVGPFIEPGLGPCLYCIERHQTDADPAWPAMASQLWGRSSTAEDAVSASEVVAIVMRLVVARLAGGPAESATSVRLDVAAGSLTHRDWDRHPACECATLPVETRQTA